MSDNGSNNSSLDNKEDKLLSISIPDNSDILSNQKKTPKKTIDMINDLSNNNTSYKDHYTFCVKVVHYFHIMNYNLKLY